MARIRTLLDTAHDPWQRANPLHITASAMIVHRQSERVLLRWHQRQHAWLQVGGHADPGETNPIDIALREGCEETGLTDLAPWPDAEIVHVAIVSVLAKRDDPAHEHADLRFVLATVQLDAIWLEKPDALLRWLSLAEAREVTTEVNVHETLRRVASLLG